MRLLQRLSVAPLIAVCALAATIGTLGGAVALFEAMVLNPVRVERADRLVHLAGLSFDIPGYDAEAWWSQASALESVALYRRRGTSVSVDGVSVPSTVALVSSHFFDVMAHRAAAGRLIAAGDAAAYGARAMVLSHAFARRVFGDPDAAVGREVFVGGTAHVVVGVAAADATFPRLTDAWVLTDSSIAADVGHAGGPPVAWSGLGMGAVGRLADGASVASAGDQMTALLHRLESEVTPRTGIRFGHSVRTLPLREVLAREPRAAVTSFLAFGLLGVCLAGLSCGLLVLNEQLMRQRDWAMRQALGATPAMLKRATAVKALRMAGAAAVTGIVTMYGVLSLVSAVAETSGYFVPTTTVIRGGTWLVALLSAGGAAGLVAAVPAAWASRAPLATILTDRRPYGPAKVPGWMIRAALVGTQTCVGMVIVAAAGFSTSHLLATLSFDWGHRPDAGVWVVRLQRSVGAADGSTPWGAVWSAVEGVPGIKDVAMISELPLDSSGGGVWVLSDERKAFVSRRFVKGPFDRVLGIAPIQGAAEPVPGSIVVSSALRASLAGDRALTAIRFDGAPNEWPVSGELQSLRFPGKADAPEAATYLRLEDATALGVPVPAVQLLVSCPGSCSQATLDDIVRAVTPHADVRGSVVTLSASYDRASRPAKAWALAANVYAGLTLLIVLLGAYTLSGAVVVRSAFEAGMRLALGASRADVVSRLVARVCTPATVGIAIGLALTAVAIRHFALLNPTADVGRTLSVSAALLLLTCTGAALLPAVALVRRPLLWLLRRD